MAVVWGHYRDALDPEFASDVDATLGPLPDMWVVRFGRRSDAEQKGLHDRYLAGGPLAAKPGHSAHGVGLAIDCARRTAAGQLSWDTAHPAWARLWAAVRKAPQLHSGHDFPPVAPADDDHIQSTKWYAVRRAMIAAGEW